MTAEEVRRLLATRLCIEVERIQVTHRRTSDDGETTTFNITVDGRDPTAEEIATFVDLLADAAEA